ncbi:MAG: cysteine desulfurase family protein [Lachnospiraceae bacterium]
MEAYLDNSATTRMDDAVLALMERVYKEDFGNPSSRHKKGMEAERYIKTAKEQIAATLKCKPEEILFTSGGTESNNMALIGSALANRRRGTHIITTAFEHASVYQPLFFLEELGFRITYLAPDENGRISVESLRAALCPETILVSVMAVNNEVGAVQDIATLGEVIKEYNSEIVYHVDAIQAYGKYRIYPKRQNIDLLSVSAHKLHGPKGCGFLYIKERTKIKPLLYGGGQQKGLRSGTENVPGIAGTGLAAELACAKVEELQERLFSLKEFFAEGLSQLEGVTVHLVDKKAGEVISPQERKERLRCTAPHIMSVGFAGVRSEVLLHALEEKGIYVSSGSACSSNHPEVSGTLKAIGVDKELLDATVRFSFCRDTTKEELEYTLSVLKELLPQLRRFWRK